MTNWTRLYTFFRPLRTRARDLLLDLFKQTESSSATLFDVYFANRLLRHVPLSPDEWRRWRAEVEPGHVSVTTVVERLTDATLETDTWIDLGDYRLCVNALDTMVGYHIATSSAYESHVAEHFRSRISRDTVILDIGANMGWYTMLAAARAPQGRVIAVEALPDNVRLLWRGIRANGFRNVDVWPIAAAQDTRCVAFYAPHSNGTILTDASPNDRNLLSIPAVRLDALLGDLERLDVVKIDVEGYEPYALQGMTQALLKHRPAVFCEFHPALMNRLEPDLAERTLRWWRDLGYRLSVIAYSGELKHDLSDAQIWAEWRAANRALGVPDELGHVDLLAEPIVA